MSAVGLAKEEERRAGRCCFGFFSHPLRTERFVKPFSLLPAFEHLIHRVKFRDIFTPATLLKSHGREMVGYLNCKRYSAAHGDLMVEDPNGFRRRNAYLVKYPFRLAFRGRFNPCVYNCCFHADNVSHMQHRHKSYLVFSFNGFIRQKRSIKYRTHSFGVISDFTFAS